MAFKQNHRIKAIASQVGKAGLPPLSDSHLHLFRVNLISAFRQVSLPESLAAALPGSLPARKAGYDS